MKKFREFLENYDVYLDKPMGFKQPEETETEKKAERTLDKDVHNVPETTE